MAFLSDRICNLPNGVRRTLHRIFVTSDWRTNVEVIGNAKQIIFQFIAASNASCLLVFGLRWKSDDVACHGSTSFRPPQQYGGLKIGNVQKVKEFGGNLHQIAGGVVNASW